MRYKRHCTALCPVSSWSLGQSYEKNIENCYIRTPPLTQTAHVRYFKYLAPGVQPLHIHNISYNTKRGPVVPQTHRHKGHPGTVSKRRMISRTVWPRSWAAWKQLGAVGNEEGMTWSQARRSLGHGIARGVGEPFRQLRRAQIELSFSHLSPI